MKTVITVNVECTNKCGKTLAVPFQFQNDIVWTCGCKSSKFINNVIAKESN